MAPQKKAAQIIEDMECKVIKAFGCESGDNSKSAAHRCSLICCDEVIEALRLTKAKEIIVDDAALPMDKMKMIGGVDYWERVKIAIKLL